MQDRALPYSLMDLICMINSKQCVKTNYSNQKHSLPSGNLETMKGPAKKAAEPSLRMRLSSGFVSEDDRWENTESSCMSEKATDILVKHKCIRINGIPTRMSYAVPENSNNDVAIVVIPGNPGSIGFYDIFISKLFRASGGNLAIYGVSHAGTNLLLFMLLPVSA